ncbi:MAG: T9SS type A sorting domain-containing protein [Bacteroidetes bacterium]|nr:T9SS type A sorting domain-containing protein [Bacteroidota bacterium]
MSPALRVSSIIAFLFALSSASSIAQGNIDWVELWRLTPPGAQPQHPLAWMNDSLSYTRLAYDELRDVVYVVSPHPAAGGLWSAPAIMILDAETGQLRTDMGRSAHFARRGQGGELPVPVDTFITANNHNLGFGENWFGLYGIDVDDEGRIYACNLVDPIWGICISLPLGGCDPMYLQQGPLRVWRWNTPTSTPELIYATCNTAHTAIGNISSSELPYARWGDAFAVKGKRGWYQPPLGGPPVLVDSTRIYISGGTVQYSGTPRGCVAVLVSDQRDSLLRPVRDVMGGGRLSFRLGLQIDLPPAAAAHGIAPELLSFSGDTLQRWIWLRRHGESLFKVRERQLTSAALPQYITPASPDIMTVSNPASLFGPSGAMEFLHAPQWGRSFLAVGDGVPTGGTSVTVRNDNTTARLIDITTWGAFFPIWGTTPQLGDAPQWSIGQPNYISDVDIKMKEYTPQQLPDGAGTRVILFTLMSNNGIAAFRDRPVPVDLVSLHARPTQTGASIEWVVAMEENIQQYLVERGGTESGPWSLAGSISARGGEGNLAYAFEDNDADPGRVAAGQWRDGGSAWYRLTAQEFDGSRKIFPPVMVDRSERMRPLEMSLFPQPVSPAVGSVYLLMQSPQAEEVTLRVVDLLGREALPQRQFTVEAGRTLLPLRIEHLFPGVYLVQTRLRNGSTKTQRLIVR